MGKCAICGKSTGVFSRKTLCKKCYLYFVLKDKDFMMKSDYTNNLMELQKGEPLESYLDRCSAIHSMFKISDEIDVDDMSDCDYKISYLNFKVGQSLNNFYSQFIKTQKSDELHNFINIINNHKENYLFFESQLNFLIECAEKRINILKEQNNDEYFFDIKKMKSHDQMNNSYFISQEYRNKIIKDIVCINDIINMASNNLGINIPLININKLNFNRNYYDYVYLLFDPLTKTGRRKKTPFTLFFEISNDGKSYESHGEICYLLNGEINSIKLRTKDYLINFGNMNKNIAIKSIRDINSEKGKYIYKM